MTVKFSRTQNRPIQPEPPRPLTRELPPATPFPIDALGNLLGPAANAINDRVRAPIAIGAQSVLAAATLAAQAHVDVVLPIGGGSAKPVSSYFITVANTGERKSASDLQAVWPIVKHEKALRDKYDAALPSFENDKAAWEKARERALQNGKGDRTAIKGMLDAIGPPPTPLLQPMLTCPEPTLQGLCKLFATGQPSLGLFSTEDGQFIGGHGMNPDNKLMTVTGLSGIWDGDPIRRVRSGDGFVILPGRRLVGHLMVQPEVATILLGDPLLAGQGFLSRMLVAAPESNTGTRLHRNELPQTDPDLKRYGARLLDILETPMPLAKGKSNELEPRHLKLSSEAERLFFSFHDYVELAMTAGGHLDPIKGLGNKLPEHAARLAAVLTVVGDVHAREVAGHEMDAGIALAEYYAGEALRLFSASQVNADLLLAKKLLDWLHLQAEPMTSLPDIYQCGPNAIREQATTLKLVKILEGHGWINKVEGGAIIAGHLRRDVWAIVPRRTA
jgi:Protein of unknown function (DUF3987)